MSRLYFLNAKNYDSLILSIVCREFDRCFDLDFCLLLFEKLRFFNPFDRMSGIPSASASRPNCQGVCPPLFNCYSNLQVFIKTCYATFPQIRYVAFQIRYADLAQTHDLGLNSPAGSLLLGLGSSS
jgi:hypothetical protein